MALPSPSTSRRTVIALSVAASLLAGTGGVVVWIRQAPSAVTLDDAVARFRGGQETNPPSSTAAPTAVPGTTEPGAPTPDATTGDGAATPVPTAPGVTASEPGPTASTAPGPGAGARWPDDGVYSFATEGGGETNALGGARHDYPAEVPVIVQRAGCGYTVRWQPLDERWDEWEFCPGGGANRAMVRISIYHEFFQRGQRQDFDCGRAEMLPADQPAGATYRWSCRSSGAVMEATTTVVGVETLEIGGTAVQALHSRHDAVFTGANEGSQVFEWWVELETGLPIKMTRDLQVRSNSPFGKVDYRERFSSTAMSLVPRR